MTRSYFRFIIALVIFSVSLFQGATVFAATGTIVSGFQQSVFLDQDLDSDGFPDLINWIPRCGATAPDNDCPDPVTVSDTELAGTIWGESGSWISLNCTDGDDADCATNDNYHVANDGSGNLSGYAWGDTLGYISFWCGNETPNNCATNDNFRVTIDPDTGEFSGYAWSNNFGYIKFECPGVDTAADADSYSDTCVKTDWRPGSDDSDPGGGGGTTTGSIPTSDTSDICLNIANVQTLIPNGYYQIITNAPDIGNCYPIPADVCPNLDGNQSVVPSGYIWNTVDLTCDLLVQPPSGDICPNLSGVQTSVPNGYSIDNAGDCITNATPNGDVCPNISGIQTSVPNGYSIDGNGYCVLGSIDPTNPTDPTDIIDYCSQPGIQTNPADCPGPIDYCPDMNGIQNDPRICATQVSDNVVIDEVSRAMDSLIDYLANISPSIFSWLLPIIAVVGFLGTVPGLATRFANLILTFVFARKKQRGVVYDAKTKEPLDPAYVTVFDHETGKEVGNQITDLEGRYGFVLKKGTYHMTVSKTNYQFPSIALAGKQNDEVYDHLYFGEPFAVGDNQEVVLMNIPMDPIGTDWNQQEKRRMNMLKFLIKNQKTMGWVFNILFAIGFAASILITWYYPVWWNIIMTALYVVIALVQAYGLGPVSVGTITKNGQPLANAIVRVYNLALDREVAHKVTTDLGGYYILVPKADYYVTVEEKLPDGNYQKIFTSGTLRASHGLINKTFHIM